MIIYFYYSSVGFFHLTTFTTSSFYWQREHTCAKKFLNRSHIWWMNILNHTELCGRKKTLHRECISLNRLFKFTVQNNRIFYRTKQERGSSSCTMEMEICSIWMRLTRRYSVFYHYETSGGRFTHIHIHSHRCIPLFLYQPVEVKFVRCCIIKDSTLLFFFESIPGFL